ncbi:MAG: DUF4412 domain-containing protein [Acidobacteriota bacterium]
MLSLRNLKKVALMVLLLPLVGAIAAPPGGDLYVEQKVTTSGMMGRPGTTSTQMLWMTKDMMRSEDPEQQSAIIFRLDKNLFYMLNMAEKTYQEMTSEDFKKMLSMGGAMFGKEEEAGKLNLTKTGQRQKIGQWDCYQVIMEQPDMKIDMWITEEVTYDTTLFKKYMESMGGPFFSKEVLEQWAALKGYPIKTETTFTIGTMKTTSTTLVTKVSQKSIAKDIFSPPPDYKKVLLEMPGIPPEGN